MEKTKYEMSTAVAVRFRGKVQARAVEEKIYHLDLEFLLRFLHQENFPRPLRRISDLIDALVDLDPKLGCRVGIIVAEQCYRLDQKWLVMEQAFRPLIETEVECMMEEGMVQRGVDD